MEAVCKILFLIEELSGGGAEKVLCNLVNHMDQTKFDITVETVWPADAGEYLSPGIHYKSMYPNRNAFYHFLYRAEAASHLAYCLRVRGDYDIECAYLEMGTTKIMASSTNKKAKKIAWVHCDLLNKISDPQAYAMKTTRWYEQFDQIVCVSKSVKEHFDELFQNRFNSLVLYNVIDAPSIQNMALLPLPKEVRHNRVSVLSVGRLSAEKNYLRLLKAHKQLMGEGIEHDLWILGEGPQRPILEQFVKENGLINSVWMPGFIKNPYSIMREADVLACSSDYEGYSTFLTEGIILGKPIVTTDVSGAHELLGNSEFGLIVKNNDESLYRGLRTLLTDVICREKYAKAALLRSKDFSLPALVDTTERFFEEQLVR